MKQAAGFGMFGAASISTVNDSGASIDQATKSNLGIVRLGNGDLDNSLLI